ncbi:MAG: hypothetical protein CMQ20_16305 [Gammaproteobacteria bacterium]|jgi:uncharacterized membrane protein|nr:hypothetical protein [Gammaproteobacteria bacterium]|tara:strand:+ start:62 stop:595 length:534 start_codon:yes stop_codon:yes gene_type:complete
MDWSLLIASFIHDLALAAYVGGAIAMEFILAPAQASIPPAQAQIMGEKSSGRFLILVWVSLILILLTGIYRLYWRGLLFGESFLVAPLTWDYSYGRTLLVMTVFWCILMINGALITFIFRPILSGKMQAGSSQSQGRDAMDAKMKAATWVQNLTRVDVGLAVATILLGASLSRGGLL